MEDYVSFEQAVKLKKLGFDWSCIGFYNHYKIPCIEHYISNEGRIIKEKYNDNFIANTYNVVCSAPTMTQVQKWLREKHYLSIEIYTSLDINSNWEWDGFVKNLNDNLEDEIEDTAISCKTYEEALSKCIDKAIEILINKNK